jgi:hypothetical protein
MMIACCIVFCQIIFFYLVYVTKEFKNNDSFNLEIIIIIIIIIIIEILCLLREN